MNGHERSQLEVVDAKIDVIDTKVDRLLVHQEFNEQKLGDHEARIRGIERWKLSIPLTIVIGIAAIVEAIRGR